MKYFDTTYLVRLYSFEPGWQSVRALAASNEIGCSVLGKAEVIGAFHRKFREGQITKRDLAILIDEFDRDAKSGGVSWFPLSEKVLERLTRQYQVVPSDIALRTSDAIHLATAAENGLAEIYTNDRRLLLAAEHFDLIGSNLI